ncbi:DUF2283 domain-containing protein [Luteococcus sp. Sow4_B9]|uniref:DUF2283 domain-containing protein n=1 Tax=Actinomycetes TaxID=1760 RepID=UPI00217DBE54|nr:DUF2283 domain-containing protein [Brachybacterium sillae]MCS6711508.1 DUF2283 domain-containing protein [Brachybacterium sillae]
MRLTYDRDADAAYLMVVDSIAPGEATHQVELTHDGDVAGQFILDFDTDGKLLGLEVLFASDALHASVIAAAEPK